MPNRPSLQRGTDRERLLFDAIAKGHSMRAAAGIAGVGERTAWRHLERNQAARNDYELAQQRAEAYLTTIVVDAAATDAKHAEWLLARKWPERYGDRTAIDMSATIEGRYDVEILAQVQRYSGMTADEVEREIQRLAWAVPPAEQPGAVVGQITTNEASLEADSIMGGGRGASAPAPAHQPPATQPAATDTPPRVATTPGDGTTMPTVEAVAPLQVQDTVEPKPCQHCRGWVPGRHQDGCPDWHPDGRVRIGPQTFGDPR